MSLNSGWMHDFIGLMHQSAAEQVQDLELNLIGHVIEYDEKVNMVRVLLPTRRAEDEEDGDGEEQTMETGWLHVGSPIVGNGWGFQYCLKGGATKDEPEKGEACMVNIQHRASGLAAIVNFNFNDEMKAPGGGDDEAEDNEDDDVETDREGKQKLTPSEFIWKHESGAFLKFYKDGSVRLTCTEKLFVEVKDECNLRVTEGDVNIQVDEGDVSLNVDLGDVDVFAPLGDITIESLEGNININTESGDIDIDSSAGAVTVNGGLNVDISSDAEINVAAPLINVLGESVNIGADVFQSLCNEAFMVLYNSHIHITPDGPSGPPTMPAIEGIETTVNLRAS